MRQDFLDTTPSYINIHRHEQQLEEEKDTLAIECFLYPTTLSELNPRKPFSYGVHPEQACDLKEEDWDKIKEIFQLPQCLFIGEAGLDKLCSTPLSSQIEIFRRQIFHSEQLQKPLLIHCVRAFDELIALKKTIKPQLPWIIHGFRGKRQQAEQLLRLGFYLSFGRYYHIDSLRFAYQNQRLLIETDTQIISIKELYRQASSDLLLPLEELIEQEQHIYQSLF